MSDQPAVPQAVRVALEFPSWYRFRTSQCGFRDFADEVCSQLVTNGAPTESIEIRVRSQPDSGVITASDDPDDFRWAFGRLLAGDGKARINAGLILSFPADNWVRVDNGRGDLRRSRPLRLAAMRTEQRGMQKKTRFIVYQDATEALRLMGEPQWYNKGSIRPFRGLEVVDLWILADTLRRRQTTHRESTNAEPPPRNQEPTGRPDRPGGHQGGSW